MAQPFSMAQGDVHDVQTSNDTADVKTFVPAKGARGFYIQSLGANAWVTIDDSGPTDTQGMEILAGVSPQLIPVCPTKLKACAAIASPAKIKVTWLG